MGVGEVRVRDSFFKPAGRRPKPSLNLAGLHICIRSIAAGHQAVAAHTPSVVRSHVSLMRTDAALVVHCTETK
jgi:hypothetical protein